MYQVRLSGSTVWTPVDWVSTNSGRTFAISCAITPNCRPSFFTTAAFGLSKSTISSSVLYSKLRTCIWLRISKPVLLSTIFFLILSSDVVFQLEVLLPLYTPLAPRIIVVSSPKPVVLWPSTIDLWSSAAAKTASSPIAIFLPLPEPPPVVRLDPALYPIRVLRSDVVRLYPALLPIRVL